MAEVTMKSTKQEIMDALETARKEIEEVRKSKFAPSETAEATTKKIIVESAKESVQANLFSEEMSKKYSDLEKAIEIKMTELSELYDVEKELQDVVTIVNAKTELIKKLDAEYAEKKAAVIADLEEQKASLKTEISDLVSTYGIRKDELTTARAREIEEYKYNLKRKRDIENDEWADEVAQREALIAAKETEAQALYDDAKAKADYIVELEAKIEAIPGLIEEAKTEAVSLVSKELGKEYGYSKAMTAKDFAHETEKLTDKVDFLTSELCKSNTALQSANEKLDNAYKEIREIATKTVESTGGVKILSNSNENRK